VIVLANKIFVKDKAKSVYIYSKYNFFNKYRFKTSYVFYDYYLLLIFWKEFFMELNAYDESEGFIYDFFDNFNKFSVFRDFGDFLQNQWTPFFLLFYVDVESYDQLLAIRKFYLINEKFFYYNTNKVLYNLFLILLREEHYKLYYKVDLSKGHAFINYY